jgi:hypothetical protein
MGLDEGEMKLQQTDSQESNEQSVVEQYMH